METFLERKGLSSRETFGQERIFLAWRNYRKGKNPETKRSSAIKITANGEILGHEAVYHSRVS
jgi:hypothetical protein